MPVYQDKKSKLWYFRCYCNDIYGNRKQFQRNGFNTKRDAQAAERNFIGQGKVNDETILFSKLWDEYNK